MGQKKTMIQIEATRNSSDERKFSEISTELNAEYEIYHIEVLSGEKPLTSGFIKAVKSYACSKDQEISKEKQIKRMRKFLENNNDKEKIKGDLLAIMLWFGMPKFYEYFLPAYIKALENALKNKKNKNSSYKTHEDALFNALNDLRKKSDLSNSWKENIKSFFLTSQGEKLKLKKRNEWLDEVIKADKEYLGVKGIVPNPKTQETSSPEKQKTPKLKEQNKTQKTSSQQPPSPSEEQNTTQETSQQLPYLSEGQNTTQKTSSQQKQKTPKPEEQNTTQETSQQQLPSLSEGQNTTQKTSQQQGTYKAEEQGTLPQEERETPKPEEQNITQGTKKYFTIQFTLLTGSNLSNKNSLPNIDSKQREQIKKDINDMVKAINQKDKKKFIGIVKKYNKELADPAGMWYDRYAEYLRSSGFLDPLLKSNDIITDLQSWSGKAYNFYNVNIKSDTIKPDTIKPLNSTTISNSQFFNKKLNKFNIQLAKLDEGTKQYLSLLILERYGASDLKDLAKVFGIEDKKLSSFVDGNKTALDLYVKMLNEIAGDENFFKQRDKIINRWKEADKLFNNMDIISQYIFVKNYNFEVLKNIEKSLTYTTTKSGEVEIVNDQKKAMNDIFSHLSGLSRSLGEAGMPTFITTVFPKLLIATQSSHSLCSAIDIIRNYTQLETAQRDWYAYKWIREYMDELGPEIDKWAKDLLTQMRYRLMDVMDVSSLSKKEIKSYNMHLKRLDSLIKFYDILEQKKYFISNGNISVKIAPIDIFGRGDEEVFKYIKDRRELDVSIPDLTKFFHKEEQELLESKKLKLRYLTTESIDWVSTLAPSGKAKKYPLFYYKLLNASGVYFNSNGDLVDKSSFGNINVEFLSPNWYLDFSNTKTTDLSDDQKHDITNLKIIANDIKGWKAGTEVKREVIDENVNESLDFFARKNNTNVVLYADVEDGEQVVYAYVKTKINDKDVWLRLGRYTGDDAEKLMYQFKYNAATWGTELSGVTENGNLIGGLVTVKVGSLGAGISLDKNNVARAIVMALGPEQTVSSFKGGELKFQSQGYGILYFNKGKVEGVGVGGTKSVQGGILTTELLKKTETKGILLKSSYEKRSFMVSTEFAEYLRNDKTLNRTFSFGTSALLGRDIIWLMFTKGTNQGGGVIGVDFDDDKKINYAQLSYSYIGKEMENELYKERFNNYMKKAEELAKAIDDFNEALGANSKDEVVNTIAPAIFEAIKAIKEDKNKKEYLEPVIKKFFENVGLIGYKFSEKTKDDIKNDLKNCKKNDLIKSYSQFLVGYNEELIKYYTEKWKLYEKSAKQKASSDMLKLNQSADLKANLKESFNKLIDAVYDFKEAAVDWKSLYVTSLSRFWGLKLTGFGSMFETILSYDKENKVHLLFNTNISLGSSNASLLGGSVSDGTELSKFHLNLPLGDLITAGEFYLMSNKRGGELTTRGTTVGITTNDIFSADGYGIGYMLLGNIEMTRGYNKELQNVNAKEYKAALMLWDKYKGLLSSNSWNVYAAVEQTIQNINSILPNNGIITINGKKMKIGFSLSSYDPSEGEYKKLDAKGIWGITQILYSEKAKNKIMISDIGISIDYISRSGGIEGAIGIEGAKVWIRSSNGKYSGWRIGVTGGGNIEFSR